MANFYALEVEKGELAILGVYPAIVKVHRYDSQRERDARVKAMRDAEPPHPWYRISASDALVKRAWVLAISHGGQQSAWPVRMRIVTTYAMPQWLPGNEGKDRG